MAWEGTESGRPCWVEQRECAVQRKKCREQNGATSILAPDHEILGNGQYVGSAEVVELEELEKALASPSLRVFGWKDIGLGEDGKIMSIFSQHELEFKLFMHSTSIPSCNCRLRCYSTHMYTYMDIRCPSDTKTFTFNESPCCETPSPRKYFCDCRLCL
jgi:hypothetical protein